MIRLKDVEMEYPNGTRAIRGISAAIEDGEFVFLVGPSGSGKSTIIKMLTGEEVPTAGRIMINGFSVSNIAERQIPMMRRTLGVIFQDFRLIEKKTVYENLEFVMRAVGMPKKEIKQRITYVLQLVGLEKKAENFPSELSGGEQQRVAIARALVNNPATGINACTAVMGKDVPQVAVFDTAFHQTMPAKAYMYALPYEYYENDKVRRYGFHGTSHKYVSQRAAAMLGKKPEELKLISCHLGNGSSVTAVDGGKSVDTSMGFTPLAGLPMGTRAGDLDAGILQYLMNKYDMNIDTMLDILNKKSGVQGVSGVSSDFRDLENAHKEGNERAGLAVDMFNYGVKKLIGAYAAAMGGVDAIIFTAGVGENSASQRLDIASGLEFMGVKMDAEANNVRGKEAVISAADSKVKVLLIPTNEELMIAMDTASIVKG